MTDEEFADRLKTALKDELEIQVHHTRRASDIIDREIIVIFDGEEIARTDI
ncbi:hypothetical protein [Shouchella clausii]|uniref:hypothetical protein n=1 Tax=Shouchella clausii TaxID=79880 RepID=UPI001C732A71|nr:hypothetical protein [Shouchella clausii]MBX0320288.1 hypothetical protein [Shouchella clausii]